MDIGKKVVLISPRFNKEVSLYTGFNNCVFQKGPFCSSYFESKLDAILFALVSVITLGYFWFYISKNGNILKINKLLRQGYKFKDDTDKEFTNRLLSLNYLNSNEGEKVRFSRTGSADDTLKPK